MITITGKNIHNKLITHKFTGYQLKIVTIMVEENRHIIRTCRQAGTKDDGIWYISKADDDIMPEGRRLHQKPIMSLYHNGIIKGVNGVGEPHTGRSYSFFLPDWVLEALKLHGIGCINEPAHKEKLSLDTQ